MVVIVAATTAMVVIVAATTAASIACASFRAALSCTTDCGKIAVDVVEVTPSVAAHSAAATLQ
jgi:multidrug resistance efflux pump